MKINDIYTAYMSWGNKGKRRPVLVAEVKDAAVIVFKITTKYDSKSNYIKNKYYKIADLTSAGLKKTSYIDTVRNYELDLNKVKFQKIGCLSTKDINDLNQFIKKTATNDIS
ncbi:type II toxin-antitoxin system PemK/MazF family toxin [Ligilactobacillus agilis]|uniref:type II toxin-antitoxin system PemK/MazF family toxin n=1 Tax=Ligilactobacillus agilis TaxID=1601 RepID=UPI00255CC28B|nr:type II toxin-antitoxin system PemK/MazF family toxin [Ligilactobacillus agilis]